MNRSLPILIWLLPLLFAGCFIMGDRGNATIVSLKLPVSKGSSDATLESSEVKEALGVIDSLLVSHGLTRVPMSEIPASDGTIRHYQGPPKGCGISLENNTLLIVFSEFGPREPTEPVKKVSSVLAEELKKHYGPENVRLTIRH